MDLYYEYNLKKLHNILIGIIEDYMEEGYIIYTATIEGKTKIISWIMGMASLKEWLMNGVTLA